ncbi:Pyrophosphate-energized membrane proton pump 3 [Galdieria sulphuraria]|uniref:H(+)-exporting diphosphatase n=1 Tax=Galdieria sulphuraria TaxID=130081 RepID=M2Y519_GALSU|nr:H+-translocating PPase (vacuolar) [Galdieria sulphuraria]EME31068.1 H+-translocating PPase (vacuolar) [Galdieria sulphuraria]GJD12463.1 Pyrophosphate-energized membrane proton pump 3 [Galdieria sulphuraria]|eukprot:XP_005707588.1 H+-translocating PPase (vacuolar) [Galdieria sulphuraria]
MSSAVEFLWVLVGVCVVALCFAGWLAHWVLSHKEGSKEMQDVARPIQEGANGFFKTQYGTIASLSLVLALIIFLSYGYRPVNPSEANIGSLGIRSICTIAFLLGGFFSGISGLVAMWVAVRSNSRVAAAAKVSYNEAIQVAFRGGAFASTLIVTLCLFGIVLIYAFVYGSFQRLGVSAAQVPLLIVGYGFGASFVALFAQLGGGIYTKAADVGADIVGKVEAGIPEDDPRNPAVVADLVGDNVGDCAGRGADLFESIAAENIGAMILGATLSRTCNLPESEQITFTLFPLFVHALGIFSSSIGTMAVRTKDKSLNKSGGSSESAPLLGGSKSSKEYEDPMAIMKRGFVVAMALGFVGIWVLCYIALQTSEAPNAWWHFGLCATIGIVTSYCFVIITEYYTDYLYYPVRRIAAASSTGSGTNVIAGVSVGMESTALPIMVLAIALLLVYWLGTTSGLSNKLAAGIFGTAVATMGMLSTSCFILAMDVFGPISDNAGGIAEMSMQPPEVREITDRLDAVGNTTKALTKGYAVGSAALAAFLLFRAYIDEVNNYLPSSRALTAVDLSQPEVFVGGMIGAMLVFLFSGLAIRAVGNAAQAVVHEVRRQFREKPGIMTYSEKPDYEKCVAIVANAALKQMVVPGLLVVFVPLFVGFLASWVGRVAGKSLLGVQVSAGILMVGTIAGILMALFLNNSGGAWDNAKKYIETGAYGGKGSESHKASVTGDTVGDPFKDTAGPSLHVLVKLLSTLTLVFGPLFLTSAGIEVISG